MARPPKEINWEIVEKRMEAGESAESIAHRHFIDVNTLYRRFKKEYGCSFGDYISKFQECGKGNILFTQYMKAISGNIPMLLHLGKELCNQGKDQKETSPFEDVLSLKHENMILKAELAEIKEKLNADKS